MLNFDPVCPSPARWNSPARTEAGLRFQDLITVHHPVQLAGLGVHHQAMDGNFRADERAVRMKSHALMTFCRSLPNMPKNSLTFSGNRLRSTPERLEFVQQLHRRGLADLAIRVADDGDLAAALDRAGQRQRPQVLLIGPEMMLPALRSQMNCSAGSASAFGKKALSRGSMHVSAMTGNASANPPDADRRSRPGHRPVVRVNDGFKEAHMKSEFELLGNDKQIARIPFRPSCGRW